MNWGAIGAIAELLAAVAVIFSFVYLAGQIRQSTRAQRRANLGDIAADLNTTLRCVAADPELASLALRALADLSSLDPVERYRFDSHFYCYLASMERALLDARDDEYPEELLVPMKAAIAGFLRTAGGRAWWEERHVWFSSFGQQTLASILEDRTIDHGAAGPRLVAQSGHEAGVEWRGSNDRSTVQHQSHEVRHTRRHDSTPPVADRLVCGDLGCTVSRFEYLSVLISIVIALGLNEVTKSWGRLLQDRRHVRFSLLHGFWSAFILLLMIQF